MLKNQELRCDMVLRSTSRSLQIFSLVVTELKIVADVLEKDDFDQRPFPPEIG